MSRGHGLIWTIFVDTQGDNFLELYNGVNPLKSEVCIYPQAYVPRFATGYCSRVGVKVRGWAELCTCLMGNVFLRSFANRRCYPHRG